MWRLLALMVQVDISPQRNSPSEASHSQARRPTRLRATRHRHDGLAARGDGDVGHSHSGLWSAQAARVLLARGGRGLKLHPSTPVKLPAGTYSLHMTLRDMHWKT